MTIATNIVMGLGLTVVTMLVARRVLA